MENSLEDKLDKIIMSNNIINQKLDLLLYYTKNGESRANTSMFIQGLFLADLMKLDDETGLPIKYGK